jgi:CheY-like chemotaxis protein
MEPTRTPPAQATILIVEDEALLAMCLQEDLYALGYNVPAWVDSGEAAIRITGELHPNLVLMDIKLKGTMDGIAAAAQIRLLCKTQVIFMTAYEDEETMRHAKTTDPAGYLIKPLTPPELKRAIEAALAQRA